MNELLTIVRESLLAVSCPRYYETERGFQGALLAELNSRLPSLQLADAIVEQEYQKRMPEHGIRIRPGGKGVGSLFSALGSWGNRFKLD